MELGVLNLLNPRRSALALSSQGHPGPEGRPPTLRVRAWRGPAGEPALSPVAWVQLKGRPSCWTACFHITIARFLTGPHVVLGG